MKKLKLFSLALMALFATSAWAADPTLPTDCLELPTSSTYMDALVFNNSGYSHDYYLSATTDTLILNHYLINQSSITNSKSIAWMTYNSKGSSGNDWNAAFGFKGKAYWGVNSQANVRSDRVSWYRIKGANKFIALYSNSGSSKKCIVSAYEITYNGDVPSKSSTASVTNTKQSSSQDTIQLILDSSKEYIIELKGSSTSGYYLPEVMFIAPTCKTNITTQPVGATIAVGDANPTLTIAADEARSYTWKESSDGEAYDGVESLGSDVSFTPLENDAAQTKYYYCEVLSDCDGTTVVKSNIVTVNVLAEMIHVTGVSLDITSQEFTLGSTTTATLTATVAPSNADNKNVSWTSSEPTIVSVTDNGDGTAEIEGLAEGSSTITVTTADGSYTATCVVTVKPNPCASYFWFFSEADQTKNGKTNATAIFSDMVSGGSDQSGSLTVDGTTYNFTRRTGDPSTSFGSFSIPEHKVGTFYAAAISSGDGTRQLVLTETTTEETYQRDVEGPNTTWRSVEIPDLPAGTYTISKAGGNMRIGMIVLKLCDLYWTITFDSDGGSEVADIEVLDGTKATKPTNPIKAGLYFAGWYNGENKYNWDATVTSDLSLTAHWSDTPTALDNTDASVKAVKVLRNGQFFIEKNGVRYNAQGQIVR